MAGVAFSLFGEENVSTADSYPVATAYATSATPKAYQTRITQVNTPTRLATNIREVSDSNSGDGAPTCPE